MDASARCRERARGADSHAAVGCAAFSPIQSRHPALRPNGDERQPECAMNESLKVQPHHVDRAAYLYIRQSSMRQVIENTESTKRQYALRQRAIALGWPDDKI